MTLSPTPRSRRRKTRASAKLRLLLRTAVWRYLSFKSPCADCHFLLFSTLSVYFCLTPSPLCVSLRPGAQAHWSSLHPYLCSTLQVSASGAEWPGTTVSKSQTRNKKRHFYNHVCASGLVWYCVFAIVCVSAFALCVCVFCSSLCFGPPVVPAGWKCPHHLQRTVPGRP